MTVKQRKAILKRIVDEILFYVWDPIGVNDVPEARREYESYLSQIVNLSFDNDPLKKIASYLTLIENENMELVINNPEINTNLAMRIVKWKDFLWSSEEELIESVVKNYL